MTKNDLLEAVEDLTRQLAVSVNTPEGPAYSTGGLSALENAFDILGWEDPHPVPEMKCQHPDCNKWGSIGTPTKDGYRHLCFRHWQETQ